MCKQFGQLPYPGSVLEQPVDIMRMLEIIRLGRPAEEEGDWYGE